MLNVVTDNKNRTLPEIRHMFAKRGGNLGKHNSVSWMFEKKGDLVVDGSSSTEDQLLEVALEAGAEDVRQDGSTIRGDHDPGSVRERRERAQVE